jgi:hypothetical protein
MNFTSSQIKTYFKQISEEKKKLGPDLTEPGRTVTGRPRSDMAQWEQRFRMAGRWARPVSGAGYRIGTGQRASFDLVKIDGLGSSSLRQRS